MFHNIGGLFKIIYKWYEYLVDKEYSIPYFIPCLLSLLLEKQITLEKDGTFEKPSD